MRLALLTHGTRGDVQPYVALATALQDAGFTVTLAAPPNLEAFVRRCGVAYAPMSGDSQALLDSDDGKRWLSAGNHLAFLKALGAILAGLQADLDRDTIAACQGADAIVAHPLCQDRALIMAEALQVPLLLGLPFPLSRTRAFPHPLITARPLPWSRLNRLTYAMFEYAWHKGQIAALTDFRRQVGVPATDRSTHDLLDERRIPHLYGFSEHLVPRPADWPDTHHVTGDWRLSDPLRLRLGEAVIPTGLADWLDAGEAPIFVGFGSMPVEDPAAVLAMTAALARRLQTRIVIGAGWSGLAAETLPDDLFLVGAVNHEWLFPQCRAIVHHGGAGTTAASLRAGRPTLIASVFADQPFWGRRVTDLGVGAHVPFSKLTPTRLETTLRRLLRPEVTQRAEALATGLRDASGAERAVTVIKQHLA